MLYGIVVCLLIFVLVALSLAWWTARRHAALLDQIVRGIDALDAGRPFQPVQQSYADVSKTLSRTFNAIVPQLETRIRKLEGDRQLLRATLQGMTEGVVAIDARRRLLFANEAANEMLGISAAQVGRLLAELVRSPQVLELVDQSLARTSSTRVELSVPGPEGWAQARTLAVQATSLTGDPPPGAVLVLHDVTETRRLERVRQDFVANASHELKTPLTSIKAYTETLLDWALQDENVNVKFLERIDEQADRLNQLILDMLSLARLESGQELYQHRPILLFPVLRRAAEAHRARALGKRLDYAVLADADAETLVVNADEEAIQQILDNLIDNALKYTPETGRVRIRLRATPADAATIIVEDTGIGIPRSELPRVFERFYRVDKARSRELGGTGLGLSIVRHLVQALDGQVQVESTLGNGSTFTVRLPASRAPREDVVGVGSNGPA